MPAACGLTASARESSKRIFRPPRIVLRASVTSLPLFGGQCGGQFHKGQQHVAPQRAGSERVIRTHGADKPHNGFRD